MKLKALFSRRRICFRCGEQIKQTHRWHQRHIRLLFWTLTLPEHRNCLHPRKSTPSPPNEIPLKIIRLDPANRDGVISG